MLNFRTGWNAAWVTATASAEPKANSKSGDTNKPQGRGYNSLKLAERKEELGPDLKLRRAESPNSTAYCVKNKS